MPDIISKFTTHYQKVLKRALEQSSRQGRSFIEPEDILVSLTTETGSLAHDMLTKQGFSIDVLKNRAPNEILPSIDNLTLEQPDVLQIITEKLSPLAQKIVERSVMAAWRHQHLYIGSEHLLFALTESTEPAIIALWSKHKIDITNLKKSLTAMLRSTSKFPDLTELFRDNQTTTKNADSTPTLDFFCTDLTAKDVQKKLDPVIGREKEIDRLVNILARRTKNNPLLLGDPGVGKTAIVEGLAIKIQHGQVPQFLLDKRIFALDLGLVIAGTMYRGEFENRLKQIMEELKNHPEIILFIDEIHTIVGTGSAPGSLDVANMIKPALAKGFIRCIGATTLEEYKKSIEADAALERRFQVLQIKEPTAEQTIAVLKGIRTNYEDFHGVKIEDDAIEAAVQMSERYLPEKFLPDKAIDLIDEAASKLKSQKPITAEKVKEQTLQARLKQVAEAKDLAIAEENFPLANAYKDEAKKVEAELESLKQQVRKTALTGEPVTRINVAEVVALITGVPVTQLLNEEKIKLTKLEEIIGKRLVGQSEAVAITSQAIRRGRLGMNHPNKPLGSFIFLGPSGVGKTELAKIIAEEVFQDSNALIRLDMSEFAEAFNVSKMIGAPAGYVGYKDSNKLTDQVKRRPSAVVLFDEIEKAHPDVYNLLLQILDEGSLTDAAGKQINFKNTLIIMTSNLGLSELTKQAALGFESDQTKVSAKWQENFANTKQHLQDEVKRFFRPEFLNRLDGVIIFNPLKEKDLEKIVNLQIDELNSRLKSQKHKFQIVLGKGVLAKIAHDSFSPNEGARGIRRLIQSKIEDAITNKLLDNSLGKKKKLTVKIKNKELVLE